MINDPLILTFDCGTQSIRAILFNKQGEVEGLVKVGFNPYFSKQAEFCEQNPELYWKSLIEASNRLKNTNLDKWDRIIGVTITTMRDTMICLDKDNQVLRPAILWLDRRMAKCDKHLGIISRLSFFITGMSYAVKISRRKTKSNWIAENEPDLWDKTAKYVMLSAYLTYCLTGKLVDSVASQIGHIPFNYKKQKWMKESNIRFGIFNVPTNKLCELKDPGETLGLICDKASILTGIKKDLPVIATGSDKGCETIGTGCINPNQANLSFGTTSTIQVTSKKYFEPLQFMPAYPSVIKKSFNPEVEIFRGYWMIRWFKEEFGDKKYKEWAELVNKSEEELLNEFLDLVPPGAEGLMLQPYWGPGLKNPEAKGAIIGFSDIHTRAHFYRAIIEGINFGLIDGLKAIEKNGKTPVDYITVSGGGSQSSSICQITADMFNKPVTRVQTHETSGLGSALIGFMGLNEFKNYKEAINNMIHPKDTFYPNKENAEIYNRLYTNVYSKIYKKLRKFYYEIKDITKYPNY